MGWGTERRREVEYRGLLESDSTASAEWVRTRLNPDMRSRFTTGTREDPAVVVAGRYSVAVATNAVGRTNVETVGVGTDAVTETARTATPAEAWTSGWYTVTAPETSAEGSACVGVKTWPTASTDPAATSAEAETAAPGMAAKAWTTPAGTSVVVNTSGV
jgi:hypothetical protein